MIRFKKFIFKNFPFFKYIYAYNRNRREKWVTERLKSLNPGSIILDAGAGSSPYKKYCSKLSYYSQDFVQLDGNQIQDEEGYADMIDFVCDIHDIPIENNFADAILCTEVIEHVKYPIKVIEEFGRILKPGGDLFLTAPLISGLHQEPFHYYGGFTKYWYEEILSENGFNKIEIVENGDLPLTFMSLGLSLFKTMTEKLKSESKFFHKIFLILLIILSLFPLTIILPCFSWILSQNSNLKGFTAGYHVHAKKK